MSFVAFGIPLFVIFMVFVMGWPFAYFLKRDTKYQDARNLPHGERLKIWYGC